MYGLIYMCGEYAGMYVWADLQVCIGQYTVRYWYVGNTGRYTGMHRPVYCQVLVCGEYGLIYRYAQADLCAEEMKENMYSMEFYNTQHYF